MLSFKVYETYHILDVMKKIKEKTHSQALIFNDTNINFKISALQFLRVLLLTAFASFLFCN